MHLTDQTFIHAAHDRLEECRLPLLYLHDSENAPASMVLLTIEHWQKIVELVPEGEEITDLVMAHSHLVADEEE